MNSGYVRINDVTCDSCDNPEVLYNPNNRHFHCDKCHFEWDQDPSIEATDRHIAAIERGEFCPAEGPAIDYDTEPGWWESDDPDWWEDEEPEACPTCDGVGDVEELLSECPDCGGSGYL